MNWKIVRDPFLRGIAEEWGEAAAWEAGFFEDDDPTDAPIDDARWLCTPMSTVRRGMHRRRDSRAPVVLVSTGAFWPPHDGHVAMMERARSSLEASGRTVVGGFLSPGHDDYLTLKWSGAAPPASHRIAELVEFVADRPWLAVDPWEALHRRVAVNYTDVVARLGHSLRRQIDPRIDVWFVCGGDNARFSLAFARRGGCVVVGRPGSEPEFERWRTDPRVASSPNVVWSSGDHDGASRRTVPASSARVGPRLLRLRLEDVRAVRSLGLESGTWRSFQDALTARLGGAVEVTPVPIEDQPGVAAGPTISLDPMRPAMVDVGISRCFDLGGVRPLGHTARPGWPAVADQLTSVPPAAWTVIDDDRVTGGTERFLTSHLPPGVEIVRFEVAMTEGPGDVADSRDFLLGSDDGGLVVALPDGSIGRAPYLLPYVDPAVRCGLDAADTWAFSRDVWHLNAEAFDETGLRVSGLPDASAATMIAAGHDPEALLAEVCRWHAHGVEERYPLSAAPLPERPGEPSGGPLPEPPSRPAPA